MKNSIFRKDAKALWIAAITASFALSACGIKGDLKTPPPVWGDDVPKSEKPAPEPEGTDDDDFLENDLDY